MDWKTSGAPNCILMKKPNSRRQRNLLKLHRQPNPCWNLQAMTTIFLFFPSLTLFYKGDGKRLSYFICFLLWQFWLTVSVGSVPGHLAPGTWAKSITTPWVSDRRSLHAEQDAENKEQRPPITSKGTPLKMHFTQYPSLKVPKTSQNNTTFWHQVYESMGPFCIHV